MKAIHTKMINRVEDPEEFLRNLGKKSQGKLPLVEAALAFASLSRPDLDLPFYMDHLDLLERDFAQTLADKNEQADQIPMLGHVLAGKHHYRGDQENYDDPANSDLGRVMERRLGLPVALGILYIHVARSHGWEACGLSFPGHFLIRVETGSRKTILDPFVEGSVVGPERLVGLLARTSPGIDLSLRHTEEASDLDILLRLQNNIRSRLLREGDAAGAAKILEQMLWLAPTNAMLWRDLGFIYGHIGRLAAAQEALEFTMLHTDQKMVRKEAAAYLARLRSQMN